MRHFTYKNLEELQRGADEAGARDVRFEADPNEIRRQVAQAVDVGGFRVGNALAIHPMEGCDSTPDGRPDELTWRRYERFAGGGSKLVWFEATAVRQDGRAPDRTQAAARQGWENVHMVARHREEVACFAVWEI